VAYLIFLLVWIPIALWIISKRRHFDRLMQEQIDRDRRRRICREIEAYERRQHGRPV
jgi:hypothetical protein